jgi:hypothetical protein
MLAAATVANFYFPQRKTKTNLINSGARALACFKIGELVDFRTEFAEQTVKQRRERCAAAPFVSGF